MKNVLLVFGGMSYEHDISIITAAQIYNKTKLNEYRLIPFYVSKEDRYYLYETDEFLISDYSRDNFLQNKKKFKEVVFISNEKGILFSKSKFGLKEQVRAEVAIFACHGGAGENGKLVSILESFGIYSNVGSFDSLAVCMNKFLFKQIMSSLKLPVVEGEIITKDIYDNDKKQLISIIENLGFPLIIKPNNGGSSIGLFIAENERDFEQKLVDAFEFDNEVLVEKYISNTREFNIAIIGSQNKYDISEIDEPIKNHDILTFSDKYLSSDNVKSSKNSGGLKNSMASSFRNFPAKINEELSNKIRHFSSHVFKKLNLSGVVRIDYLYSEESEELYICEVNAIPGSLAYYFFSSGEYLINDFVLKLINIAENYKNNVFSINKDFITNVL